MNVSAKPCRSQDPIASSAYTDSANPYKQRHMRRAFRLGWETAEGGTSLREAQQRAGRATLNRATCAGWWRGFYTQRGEY